jgi:hypothetical protein
MRGVSDAWEIGDEGQQIKQGSLVCVDIRDVQTELVDQIKLIDHFGGNVGIDLIAIYCT